MARMKDYTNQKAKMLAALYGGHTVREACRLADWPRRTAYDVRDRDAEFRRAWDEAQEDGTDRLEEEVYKRALDKDYPKSHIMLIFLLKKRRPEFKENYKTESKIVHETVHEYSLSEEDFEEGRRVLEEARNNAKMEREQEHLP